MPTGSDGSNPMTHSSSGFLEAPPQTTEAQRMFDDDVKGVGYVTNVSRLWARLPAALNGLADLMGEGPAPGPSPWSSGACS
jgi:hypothetical protein